jgi:enoyl-CoA hydratase
MEVEKMSNAFTFSCPEVIAEVRGRLGCITLNRPRALNALSLPMVRALAAALLAWRDDPQVQAVAIRGSNKAGVFGAFSAGGDIRFFHQAVLRADAELEDFFTEEYALNHLIHEYPKPYIAFMDGIVMGGGMGVAQGAHLRIVTERTKMAMPETQIGLFPDVGGGYFLARCPGHSGEWLALTSEVIGAGEALALNLADTCFAPERLPEAWEALAALTQIDAGALTAWNKTYAVAAEPCTLPLAQIDRAFALPEVRQIARALDEAGDAWSVKTAGLLRTHSPLMQEVTLQQIRRGRGMTLADELRMERDLVRHCFNTRHLARFMAETETMEGIRALSVDKDNAPKWNPPRLDDVTPEMVQPFFVSPWPAHAHPLRDLA